MSGCGADCSVVESVESMVRELYAKSRVPPSHDFSHVERVVGLVNVICEGEKLDAKSRELALIAALLHDVGVALRGCKEDHAAISAEYAKRVLADKLSSEEVGVVVKAILEHRWCEGRSPTSRISAVLQDADRLDALGAIGIARVFAYAGYSGKSLYHSQDPFARERSLNGDRYALDHFYEKLFRIPLHLNTETARKLAKERLRVMEQFLRRFREELELTLRR